MPLPKTLALSSSEDLQELDNDIDTLFNTYIAPIDTIRSIGKPILNSNSNTSNTEEDLTSDFANIQLSNKGQESRAHTFYRMIGLPVVAPNGSFYNPGFDPNGAANSSKKKKINESIFNSSADLQNFIAKREQTLLNNSAVFSKQDITASIYSLLLRFTFPFNLLKETDALNLDDQSYTITDRTEEAKTLSKNNTTYSNDINDTISNYKTIQHAIKPFIVDYRIENVVMPDYNKICVPFLKDKKSVKINSNTSLLRPGLELIIRQRLSDLTPDSSFLKSAQNILESQNINLFTDDVDVVTLQTEVNLLATNNNISNNVSKMLAGTTSLQVNTVNKLIKTIKICIKELSSAITSVDRLKTKINFCPIFGPDGPITGSLGATNRDGFKTSSSNIDLQISELKIQKLNAEKQITDFESLGAFASPFAQNTFSEKTTFLNDQIDQLTNFKNSLLKEGCDDLKKIEMIKGEISGLGLVDVLAIYIGLWSLDLDSLISLLDELSFNRMITYNSQFLNISQVAARKTAGKPIIDILTVLKTLEHKVSQVLSFADIYFENFQLQSPTIASNLNLDGVS